MSNGTDILAPSFCWSWAKTASSETGSLFNFVCLPSNTLSNGSLQQWHAVHHCPVFTHFSWAPSLQCLCAISLSFLLPPCVFQLQSPQRNPANTFHTSPQTRERETGFALTSGLNMMRGINEIDGCLFGERWWGKGLAQWLGLTPWVELRNVSFFSPWIFATDCVLWLKHVYLMKQKIMSGTSAFLCMSLWEDGVY